MKKEIEIGFERKIGNRIKELQNEKDFIQTEIKQTQEAMMLLKKKTHDLVAKNIAKNGAIVELQKLISKIEETKKTNKTDVKVEQAVEEFPVIDETD